MFTEYQILAALIKTVEQAMQETGVTGYTVLARNPPEITRDDDVVLIDRISVRRIGFQGVSYDVPEEDDGHLDEVLEWIEERTYQISVCHQRSQYDDINSLTSDDCMAKITAWLNSPRGAAAMRGRSDVPLAPIFAKERNARVYQDESDLYQREEHMDYRFQVLQTITLREAYIAGWRWDTVPV